MTEQIQNTGFNEDVIDDMGYVESYGTQLCELPQFQEEPQTIVVPENFPVDAIDRLRIGFKRHWASEAIALSGIGFALGSTIFAHRRHRRLITI